MPDCPLDWHFWHKEDDPEDDPEDEFALKYDPQVVHVALDERDAVREPRPAWHSWDMQENLEDGFDWHSEHWQEERDGAGDLTFNLGGLPVVEREYGFGAIVEKIYCGYILCCAEEVAARIIAQDGCGED